MDQEAQTPAGDNDEKKSPQAEAKISKNQLKRQRKRELWLSIKHERRRHVKDNKKRRLAEMREKGEYIGPTRKSLKSNTMKNSSCKIRVVLDLSFDEYMAEKDVNSLTSQLQHSYSANRRAENPLQLYICSLGGKTKQRLDEIGDYKGWDVHKETQGYEELFPKESLVYLSSESPNVLTTLSEDKVYIIGGLVDHNSHKGLCHKMAEERGISHAQLPIAEYLEMKSRKVLAVNHVFSILLRYTETNDWKASFLSEMPQRKQAHVKGESSGESANQSNTATCVGGSNSHSKTLVEEGSNNLTINTPDCFEVTKSHDLNSNDQATLQQESVVCRGEPTVQTLENSEQVTSDEKESNSAICYSGEDTTRKTEHIHDVEVEEKNNVPLEVTSV